MAVDVRPGLAVDFGPLASLLEPFLIKFIGNFFPLGCVLPIVQTLVSRSTRARNISHII
jgi:hypothetical protein